MSFGTYWGTDPTDAATYQKVLPRYLPPAAGADTLDATLAAGNSAGAYNINMNTRNITNGGTFTAANLTATTVMTGAANITNAINTITLANPLVLDFGNLTFKNFYNNVALVAAVTCNSITFTNAVAGGSYMVYITTGAGGSFTFNTGIATVKTTFATAFTVPLDVPYGLIAGF